MQLGANPILGTAIHAIGGVSASTCYLPFQKILGLGNKNNTIAQYIFTLVI